MTDRATELPSDELRIRLTAYVEKIEAYLAKPDSTGHPGPLFTAGLMFETRSEADALREMLIETEQSHGECVCGEAGRDARPFTCPKHGVQKPVHANRRDDGLEAKIIRYMLPHLPMGLEDRQLNEIAGAAMLAMQSSRTPGSCDFVSSEPGGGHG